MGPVLGPGAAAAVGAAVDTLYENLKARFLGPLAVGKTLRIAAPQVLTLGGLFDTGARLEGGRPDQEALNALIRVAGGFLDSSRERTKARILQDVQATLSEAAQAGVTTDFKTVLQGRLAETYGVAGREVRRILESESTRARNTSVLDGILRVNASQDISDPVCYWLSVKDKDLCVECRRLHLMPDGVTPRLWRLSEVGHGYHRHGDGFPSIGGLHPNCFTGAMRLATDRGLLALKELYDQGGPLQVVVDARVKTRRQGGNQFGEEIPGSFWYDRHASGSVIRPASAVFDTGVRDCLRLTMESGQVLEVSEDHEQWVDLDGAGGQRIAAKNLKVGDKVPVLSGPGIWGKDNFPEEAELLGNLMGDGTINTRTCWASWRFFGDDIEYGQHLLGVARSVLRDNRAALASLAVKLAVRAPGLKYKVSSAGFNSGVLGRLFVRDFGLCKKPRRVPVRLWGASRDTVVAFLRGLYAADGHSERVPSVVLAQNDQEFLREVQLLLAQLGFRARIFVQEKASEKTITYADGSRHRTKRKPCWRLCLGGWDQAAAFAREIGLGVPAKQDRLLGFLTDTEREARLGAWRTARIAKIEPIGPQQTYCLTEPLTNTVTVQGVVTGQCRCSLATLMPGYGFGADGRVKYIGPDHNELGVQRG